MGEVADPYSPVEIASRITRIGGVPDAEMAARRARLAHVASTDLAYEAQADAVLTRLTQPAPGIAKGEPCWWTAKRSGLDSGAAIGLGEIW